MNKSRKWRKIERNRKKYLRWAQSGFKVRVWEPEVFFAHMHKQGPDTFARLLAA